MTGHEESVLKDGPHDRALILIISVLALLKVIFLTPYFVIFYHLALVCFSFLNSIASISFIFNPVVLFVNANNGDYLNEDVNEDIKK